MDKLIPFFNTKGQYYCRMVKRGSRQVRQLTEIALLNETRINQQQLCLKTLSIHNYLQLSVLKRSILDKNEPVVLIARITPIMLDNPEDGHKLLNELYSMAMKNNYSVFRLGEERIILAPMEVQVKKDDEVTEKK
jgi:SepF-like predicted cell division protein (DUF552 family)